MGPFHPAPWASEPPPFHQDTAMKRHLPSGFRAFTALTAFAVTVLLAVAATAMTLVPEETAQMADSMVSLPSHLDAILPSDVVN